jgi:hypothetical protein
LRRFHRTVLFAGRIDVRHTRQRQENRGKPFSLPPAIGMVPPRPRRPRLGITLRLPQTGQCILWPEPFDAVKVLPGRLVDKRNAGWQVPWSAYHLNPSMRAITNRRMRVTVVPGPLIGPSGVVADRVTWCVTVRDRLRGVLGREPLEPDEAYVICGSRQVHTVGVPYPLDAVFCDRNLRVLHIETLQPRSKSRRIRRSRYCIELLGGRAAACGLVPGDRLTFGGRA